MHVGRRNRCLDFGQSERCVNPLCSGWKILLSHFSMQKHQGTRKKPQSEHCQSLFWTVLSRWNQARIARSMLPKTSSCIETKHALPTALRRGIRSKLRNLVGAIKAVRVLLVLLRACRNQHLLSLNCYSGSTLRSNKSSHPTQLRAFSAPGCLASQHALTKLILHACR